MNQGIRVAGRSGWSIERAAAIVRCGLNPGLGHLDPLDGLALFNFRLEDFGEKLTGTKVLIAVKDLPAGLEGHTYFDTAENCFYVTLSERTYRGLERGESRALFTVSHETGHLALHHRALRRLGQLPPRELMMARNGTAHPTYEDSEWQANRFASAFAMPAPGLAALSRSNRLDDEQVADTYRMSYEAADYRIREFNKQDLLTAWKK